MRTLTSLILFLAYRKAQDSSNSKKINSLEKAFAYCIFDLCKNVFDQKYYSDFSQRHSELITLVHSSAAEAQELGIRHSTRYLLNRLSQNDSTKLIKEIDLWLRQFWRKS